MNYRHSFHAGSFADVFKHIIQVCLIEALKRKETSFCFIDTHAGTGYYDLFSDAASKSKEYTGGIEKIIRQDKPPQLVRLYLNCVHQINNRLSNAKFASLRYYPGSPLISKCFLRQKDRLVACELHPEEYRQLKNTLLGDKQAAVHHMDGFSGLKAFLPPKENRGIVLIDPPYENPEEYKRITQSLSAALKRWRNGVYAIWYPIKEKKTTERFHSALKQVVSAPLLAVELTIYPELPNHLNGCGMVIINPPYPFQESIKSLLPWVWKALTINAQGGFSAYLIK